MGKGDTMSRVRYVNKKTGWVSVYESVSHYDPVTKTSKPKRKYIGYEDPITKEFIPSSGQPGRKKRQNTDTSNKETTSSQYYDQFKHAIAEIEKQREENRRLTEHVQSLNRQLDRIYNAVAEFSSTILSAKDSSNE